MRGIIRMHNPSVIVAVANVDTKIKDAFRMAADSAINHIAFVLLPRNSIFKVLWMATLRPTSLPSKLLLPQSSHPPLLQPKTASKL